MKFTVFNILWQSLVDWCKENFKIKTIVLAQTQQWCSLFASEMTHGRHFKVMERCCNTSTQAWVSLSWLHWVDHAVCLTGTRLQKWMFTSELSLERAYQMFQGKDYWMCIEFPYQMLGISFPYQFKCRRGILNGAESLESVHWEHTKAQHIWWEMCAMSRITCPIAEMGGMTTVDKV